MRSRVLKKQNMIYSFSQMRLREPATIQKKYAKFSFSSRNRFSKFFFLLERKKQVTASLCWTQSYKSQAPSESSQVSDLHTAVTEQTFQGPFCCVCTYTQMSPYAIESLPFILDPLPLSWYSTATKASGLSFNTKSTLAETSRRPSQFTFPTAHPSRFWDFLQSSIFHWTPPPGLST